MIISLNICQQHGCVALYSHPPKSTLRSFKHIQRKFWLEISFDFMNFAANDEKNSRNCVSEKQNSHPYHGWCDFITYTPTFVVD